MAPRIRNLGEWRAHLLQRLAPAHRAPPATRGWSRLARSSRATPGGEAAPAAPTSSCSLAGYGGGELSFFSSTAHVGTAVDVTVAELAIEAFYPADPATAEALRSP